MDVRRLVSTYEVLGLRPHRSQEWRYDVKVEVFSSQAGVFSCRAWIIEQFSILPTSERLASERQATEGSGLHADKYLAAEMDALKFDEIRGSNEEEVKTKALALIRKLFGLE